jgi:hypothetical protein
MTSPTSSWCPTRTLQERRKMKQSVRALTFCSRVFMTMWLEYIPIHTLQNQTSFQQQRLEMKTASVSLWGRHTTNQGEIKKQTRWLCEQFAMPNPLVHVLDYAVPHRSSSVCVILSHLYVPGPDTANTNPKSDSRSWSFILRRFFCAFSKAPAWKR